jgi:predicted alpha/beta superfamily hydrolase
LKKMLCLLLCCALTSGAAAVPAYQLENTEVRDIHAAALKRDYRVFVALPDSYAEGTRKYPVLFVVDADYAFPIARGIASRLHKHAGFEEAIVVGLSYARGDTGVYSRRRDYTPTVPRDGSYRSDMPGRAPAFGEAAAYGRFVVDEVFPLIASTYRADMTRKAFAGHSYGSLLGLELLLGRPESFEHYILGSPSLWYDRGTMFDRERAAARGRRDLPASVYFGIGGLETLPAGKRRTRSDDAADMVADLRDFTAALRAHRYPHLTLQMEAYPNEDHASVFPIALTHGLRAWLKRDK